MTEHKSPLGKERMMEIDEIKKALATEREAIESKITAMQIDIADTRREIKRLRAKLDALPRLTVKRTRKAKVAT